MRTKKLYIMHRFGFYSVRQLPEDKILYNATNLQDANEFMVYLKRRNIKKENKRRTK